MKRKRLAIISIAVLLFIVGITVYYYRHQLFPSEQMITLRQLEQQLDLPKPDRRFEVDTGYETDWKRVTHYNRHISLSYADPSVLDILRTELSDGSWQEQPVKTYSSSTTHFKYVKGTGDAMICVSGYLESDDADDTPLYFQLQASGERGCNPAPGI